MPAIKKRITAEYKEREQQRSEQNGRTAADIEADRENSPPAAPSPVVTDASPLKRKAPGPPAMLKGLDGEVLVEKRKRTLPPAELKLDTWLDSNLEKKAESTLSLMKMYQFYTDMCQHDALPVVEIDVFKTMLHNKFGKEFGLQEGSPYNGLVKETKPRKKPVVAPSLGYKMKDLIEEALKASGNPSKGMMFAWLKKYLAAKYPALQIECRPHFLRKALEREIYGGRVELVKGIGFCGFYRQPGPPAVEEEPKPKKKGGKKVKKEEKPADSTDEAPADNDKEEEDKTKEDTDENSDEKTEEEQKKKKAKTEDGEEGEEVKEGEEEDKKKEKKPKKKRKRAPPKHKVSKGARHSNPQTLNDIFPLAMTYMAEPKEASFGRIRKYLEKHYGKTDIDTKLKKCMEHGIDTGMWDRVSGSGASGSFQLLVDSFNPEHTESMTDMVCSAIIACTEPKTSSVRLLKSYISEYHPEFNIDTRPSKLKFALEKAEKTSQLRRVSGIGMTGSFQLVEQFTPSPAILAGDEDEEASDYEVEEPRSRQDKEEVYVVRKTKSGRKAPIEKTQLDFSSTYKRAAPGSGAKGKKKGGSRKASKSSRYADSSGEEEESSEEEMDSDGEAYHPRASKSRGGSSAPAPRNKQAKAAKGKAAKKSKGASKKAQSTAKRGGKASSAGGESKSKAKSPAKRSKPSARSARKPPARAADSEEEEERVSSPSKSGRSSNGSTPVKKSPAKKRARSPEESDNEENYYEIEGASPAKRGKPVAAAKSPRKPPARDVSSDDDEDQVSSPTKSGRSSNGSTPVKKSPTKPNKRGAADSPASSEGRTPRSAFKAGRKSYKEEDSDEESGEEEYLARPTASRSPKKR